jgi:serine/threonine protein kinase
MELAQNDWKYDISLRSKEKKYYNEEELIEIICQIVDALAFMQSKNIAHRDIKPENILCFKNGVVKVADFGCAKVTVTSRVNTLKGTELFISPALYEALKNNIASEGVDHNTIKSDVFSLGLCTLYAATLSINPITEIRNILDHNSLYNYLKKVMKKYSQGFVNLVYRMLDLNEELRFDFFDLQDYLSKK